MMTALLDPENNLVDDQMEKYRELFQQTDTDKSGTINIDELKDLLRRIRHQEQTDWQKDKSQPKPPSNLNDRELKALVADVDSDQSDDLSFPEFLLIMAHRLKLFNERAFAAQGWCSLSFQDIGLDWCPWGTQVCLAGSCTSSSHLCCYISSSHRTCLSVCFRLQLGLHQNGRNSLGQDR